MKKENVKVLLETMLSYNTVAMKHVFTGETGEELTIRCLPGTRTFEITNSLTAGKVFSDSIEETAESIVSFISAHNMSPNS